MTQDNISVSAVALTALMLIKGIGRRAAIKIVEEVRTGLNGENYEEIISSRLAKPRIPMAELRHAWLKATEQLERGREDGIITLSYFDDDYPKRLRNTPDPPAVLFVRGSIDALNASESIAVVGTREPTEFGIEVAIRSGRSAVKAGFVVVSGLAHGCDTYGHEGCVEAKGVGIAVLAHGLDKIYPAANRKLAKKLLDLGGCLTSEYAYGVNPVRAAFAERDRIQSGLSDGVLVIETDVKGGTMHTVNFSRAQNRPLGCIAHPQRWLSEEKTKGNQLLISQGRARPIADNEALIQFMFDLKKDHPSKDIPEAKPSSEAKRPLIEEEKTAEQMAWRF